VSAPDDGPPGTNDVPRETSPAHVPRETIAPPVAAGAVFGDRLRVASAYASLLATDGTTRGLIGPRESQRLWERHLLNCAVVTDLVPEGSSVADVGSGAGLPGLVLAIRRPDLRVTLVEPLLRRTRFLDEAVLRLGLANVEVQRGRAEDLAGAATFDAVTSRAVAPLPRLLGWCLPLVRTGGAVLAMKGSSAAEEVREAAPDLARWGSPATDVVELGTTVIDPPTTVVRVRVDASTVLSLSGHTARRPSASRRAQQRGGRRRGHHGSGT
jgi:16S rRNA (guanine527-N7)-methyltransferase